MVGRSRGSGVAFAGPPLVLPLRVDAVFGGVARNRSLGGVAVGLVGGVCVVCVGLCAVSGLVAVVLCVAATVCGSARGVGVAGGVLVVGCGVLCGVVMCWVVLVLCDVGLC